MQINVLEYLEKTAARVPEKTALTDDIDSFSYAETLSMAKRIGTSLLGEITSGQHVGIFMEKCARTVAVFFGVAEAGGCYCVLNNELPPVRLNQIVEVLSPALILTTEALKPQAEEIFSGQKLLTLEAMLEVPADEAGLRIRRSRAIDTDPLYINFTSGSTGVPKGILVGHRSVIDFIDCFTELFSITQNDVIANQAPFDFDVSVKDIYSAIAVGATLAVIPRKLFSIPTALVDFLDEKGTTTMIWAVSALCLLTTFHALEYKTPASINKILFSGEVMPLKALRQFRKHLPDATYVNVYGPTEITCNCTYHILEKERDYAAGIPIGIPFPNEDVFLLDGENRRVEEAGIEGEICVRGTALALGYLENEAQNAAHFVQNPLNPRYPERIYRTGDLGRYNELGELVFSGRKDFQIKYMGHRIELEEIEREMGAITGVERCCCVFEEKRSRLMGFYIGAVEKDALHEQMKAKLPAFMVPGILRQVEEFPLNKNGKIDRKALAESVARR